jgi:glutaredoxin
MKKVTIYSRTGCHLCEIAIDKVKFVKNEFNFDLQIKLIDNSLVLEKEYGEQVPVIMINDKVHDYWRVDLERFIEAIKS